MFEQLSDKFRNLFKGLAGKKEITEENIANAVSEVRLALLDADVNYSVVKNFIRNVKEKAMGEAVIKSVKPGEQFIQIVHEELVSILGGGGPAKLNFSAKPSIFMLCGLQGTGKTTTAVKLSFLLSKKEYGKKVLVAACDLQRPAAVEQLERGCASANVAFFSIKGEKNPLNVAKGALALAKDKNYDVLILDTAGRLHIDDALMSELEGLKNLLNPQEILFVSSAQSGQDAAKSAFEFNERLSITGNIVSMLDGDSRGGAAISIVDITKKPIKFEGVGERMDDLQLFDARSMADRILGMGDTINLVKKAEEHFSKEDAEKLEEKIKKATFTYDDYLKQLQAFKKMGPFRKLFGMLPGKEMLPDSETSEKEFKKVEAIILAMTPRERMEKDDLSYGRIKRIAKGSGQDIGEVNRLKKSFREMKAFIKEAKNNKMLAKFLK